MAGNMSGKKLSGPFVIPTSPCKGRSYPLSAIVFFSLLLFAGCQGVPGGKVRLNDYQEITAAHGGPSRVAVLPFKDLNSSNQRYELALVMQREVSARLRLKGYDVVAPGEVNKILGIKVVHRSWSGNDFSRFYQKLARAFALDSLVVGSFDSRNMNLLLAKRARLSAEITFVDPESGQVILGPYQASEFQRDTSLFSFLANLATGNVIGSAAGALFVIADAVVRTDNKQKDLQNKFIAYTAYSLVDLVPPGPGAVPIPQMLDFALIPHRHAGKKLLDDVTKYGFGDRLKVRLVVRDHHFSPETGDQFFIVIKTNTGPLKFALQPEDPASRLWVGSYLFTDTDLDIEAAPLSVYYQHDDKDHLLGDVMLLDIKTIRPEISVAWMKKGEDIVFYPLIFNVSRHAQPQFQCYGANGSWVDFSQVRFSGGYYRTKATAGKRFRISVCDRNGNCVVSPAMITPDCRHFKGLVYLRVLTDKTDQCAGLNELASCIEKKLSDEFVSPGQRTVSTQGACADQLLLMKLERLKNHSAKNDFTFQLRDMGSGLEFYKSQYTYICGGEGPLQLATVDQRGLAKAFARFWQSSTGSAGKVVQRVPASKKIKPCDDWPLVSLTAARQQCHEKGARLMTWSEWLERHHHFTCLCRDGEYVENGRISYNADKNKWEFEEIFFPEALNRYRVRCLNENRR